MTHEREVRDLLKALRPSLRDDFLSVGTAFDYDIAELGFQLKGIQCSIYDEALDAVLYRSKRLGQIVANNTYLSSFAYNIAVVWMSYGAQYERLAAREECELTSLLRYNLKKFFAEQLLNRTSSVFARAIFLETLLYEERAMRPLFAAAESDPAKARGYEFFRDLMSSILLFHEVGHLVQDARTDFEDRLKREIEEGSGPGFLPAWKQYAEKAQIEFRCDTFAIMLAARQAAPGIADDFVRRAIAFAFAVCACITGLDKSAAATAQQYPASADPDLLDEYRKDMPGAGYLMGKDEFGIARARSAAAICHQLDPSGDLWAGSDFPFRPEMIDGLTEFATEIIDTYDPETRGLCELLSRALQGNERGMRYLTLRSKVFLTPEDRARLRAAIPGTAVRGPNPPLPQ